MTTTPDVDIVADEETLLGKPVHLACCVRTDMAFCGVDISAEEEVGEDVPASCAECIDVDAQLPAVCSYPDTDRCALEQRKRK